MLVTSSLSSACDKIVGDPAPILEDFPERWLNSVVAGTPYFLDAADLVIFFLSDFLDCCLNGIFRVACSRFTSVVSHHFPPKP